MDCDGSKSRIPSLRRSASVRVRGERGATEADPANCCSGRLGSPAPGLAHDVRGCNGDGSVQSVGSTASLASCGSLSLGKNGPVGVTPCTRSTKFVLHCQRHFEDPPEGYLTPTQRKERELRQLRSALARAEREARSKEERLRTMSHELERLRLGEQTQTTEERGIETDDLDDSGIVSDLPSWEGKQCSKEVQACLVEQNGGSELCAASLKADSFPLGRRPSTAEMKEDRGEELAKVQEEWSDSADSLDSLQGRGKGSQEPSESGLRRRYRDLKQRYDERTESLLQMLGDLNSKYLELRPAYETTQDRLRHLERELSEARAEIEKQEQWHSEMYLKMYSDGQNGCSHHQRRKGQEAAQFEREEDVSGCSSRSCMPALSLPAERAHHRAPLAVTPPRANDRQAEYTLRFLKDAVFYFLTDRTDCRGHLNAIQSILGFSEAERAAVAKAWRHRGRL